MVCKKPSQRLHSPASCAIIIMGIPTVCIRALLCYVIWFAQGAVLDKVGYTATLEAAFVPDGIDETVGSGCALQVGGYSKVQCPYLLFLVLLYSMTKYVFQVLDLIIPNLIFDMRVLHTLNEIGSQNDTGTVSSLDAVHIICHITDIGYIPVHGWLWPFQLGQLVFCYCCATTLREPLLELCLDGQPVQPAGHQFVDMFLKSPLGNC